MHPTSIILQQKELLTFFDSAFIGDLRRTLNEALDSGDLSTVHRTALIIQRCEQLFQYRLYHEYESTFEVVVVASPSSSAESSGTSANSRHTLATDQSIQKMLRQTLVKLCQHKHQELSNRNNNNNNSSGGGKRSHRTMEPSIHTDDSTGEIAAIFNGTFPEHVDHDNRRHSSTMGSSKSSTTGTQQPQHQHQHQQQHEESWHILVAVMDHMPALIRPMNTILLQFLRKLFRITASNSQILRSCRTSRLMDYIVCNILVNDLVDWESKYEIVRWLNDMIGARTTGDICHASWFMYPVKYTASIIRVAHTALIRLTCNHACNYSLQTLSQSLKLLLLLSTKQGMFALQTVMVFDDGVSSEMFDLCVDCFNMTNDNHIRHLMLTLVLTLMVGTHLIAFNWLGDGSKSALLQESVAARMLNSSDPLVVHTAGQLLLVLLSLKAQYPTLAITLDWRQLLKSVLVRLIVDSGLECFSESAHFFSQLLLTDFPSISQFLIDRLFRSNRYVAAIVYNLADICNREQSQISSKQTKKEIEIKLLQMREYVKKHQMDMHATIAQLHTMSGNDDDNNESDDNTDD